MEPEMNQILQKVLLEIKPTQQEVDSALQTAIDVANKIAPLLNVPYEIVGSISRGTSIKGNFDVDVFFLFPTNLSKDEIYSRLLRAASRVLDVYEVHYAEHPYLQHIVGDLKLDLVPAYNISDTSKMQSAVDRTPFHMRYLQSKLTSKMKDDVLLLKQFLKSLNLYGAELYIKGFSGYLCELLILHYGSFLNLLKSASSWKPPVFIDIENLNPSAKQKFDTPLIVVDPTDKHRNVAAPLSKTNFSRFVIAARRFLNNPTYEAFFMHKSKRTLSPDELLNILNKRNSNLVLLRAPRPEIVDDILWSQLEKAAKKIAAHMEKFGFTHNRFIFDSDNLFVKILIEFNYPELPSFEIKQGPPIFERNHVSSFLNSHNYSFGPWVDEFRVFVETPRKHTNIVDALRHILENPEKFGIPSHLRGLDFEILQTDQIIDAGEIKILSRFFSPDPIFLI